MTTDPRRRKFVMLWLALVCVTIVAMIMVGGATRLTHSGLSIVEWDPIMGVIPPLTSEQWESTFEAYKQYPEYQKVNRYMSVDEFKAIFYWEYFHRLLGRAIGVVFFVPFLYFWLRGTFDAAMRNKLFVAFLVGGLQGLMGWYMVMSGLVDMPRVSHYRLAAHLVIALFLLAYLFWLILDLADEGRRERAGASDGYEEGRGGTLRTWAIALVVLICVQIVYGAFTAGLRAGFGYNTFPMMNDRWIAETVFWLDPWWINFFENTATVQFMHRTLGILLLLAVVAFWARIIFGTGGTRQRIAAHLLLAVTLSQFLLGVFTLILVVPVTLAVVHQGVASLVLLAGVALVHLLTPRDEAVQASRSS